MRLNFFRPIGVFIGALIFLSAVSATQAQPKVDFKKNQSRFEINGLISQRGFPQFRSHPDLNILSGPWMGTMATKVFFQSTPGSFDAYDLVAGVGISIDLIAGAKEVFAPNDFKVNLSLHPSSGLSSLSGELFLWSDRSDARPGTQWRPRTLRGLRGSVVNGSALVVAPSVTLGSSPTSAFDVSGLLASQGGVREGESLTLFFQDNRFEDKDQRHLRRIFQSKPNQEAFFRDEVPSVIAGWEGASRFRLEEQPGVEFVSLANPEVASRQQGTYTRSIPLVSRSFGQGFIQISLSDIGPAQGQDPSVFGHTVVNSVGVFLPAAFGQTITLGSVTANPLENTRTNWKTLTEAILPQGGMELELPYFEDRAPRLWKEDEQYFNALILKIGGEGFLLSTMRQGDLFSDQPSRGSTWPY
jgi:hypothetical protein